MLETMRSREGQWTEPAAARCAVILAGGSGKRLQSFTRRLFGDGVMGEGRPKQFCVLFGGATLLSHTRARVAPVVPPERTAYVVVKPHAPYYSESLGDVPRDLVFAQPVDRGTTAAVALSLARVASLHPQGAEAIAGFFPADHYIADENAFAQTLDAAYRLAAAHPNTILLLGAQPEHPEVEYGWIEPGQEIQDGQSLFRVTRFWEKPSADLASGLLHRGCLWNTFVMVGRVRTFLDALKESVPDVFHAFLPLVEAGGEVPADSLGQIYSNLRPGDFSKQVLAALPDRLAVLRLDNVGWSDLGTPERVMEAWSRSGVKPLAAALAR